MSLQHPSRETRFMTVDSAGSMSHRRDRDKVLTPPDSLLNGYGRIESPAA